MKKLLLPFLLFLGFTFLGGAVLAQVAITYPSSNPVAIGTTYTTTAPAAAPTTANNVSAFGYGTGVALTATGLSGPWGMTFDFATTPNLYVVNYTSGTVYKYTAGTGTPTSFITGLTNPTGIVFDNTGVPYVSTATGYVYKFPTTAGPFTLAANGTTVITGGGAATSTTKPSSAYGIAIDQGSPQSIYLADENSGAIWRNTSGTTTRLIFYNTGSNSTYLDYPVGVQVDAAGNIYTLDNTAGLGGTGGNRPITKWTSAGGSPVSVIAGTTFTSPYGFSMDKSGNFYVSDLAGTNSSKIYSFNSSGAALATTIAITTTGTATRGVTTDASGNLFVSDYGLSKITKYPIVGGYLLNYGTSTTTLPPGIIFSSTNGKFTGTPTTAFSGNYTVTVYGTGSPSTATSAQFNINCATAPAFTYTNPPAYTVGTTIANVSPNVTAGGPLTNATSSPGLPAGLSISTTGVISGTPTMAVASQPYTITGTNASGLTGTATITIVVKPPAPAFSYANPPAYTIGVAITPVSPSVTSNGPITSASSSPTLPAGLSIDATGTISGTPTAVTASAVYTITAGNSSGGSGTATITIVVNPPPPALTYANTTFTVGTPQSLTPTYGGGYMPASCTVSPALPGGLTISNAGVISGSPTAVSASTSYTVTATNAGGTAASNSFTIVVNPAKPALTYTPTNPYTVGTTITITPTNTGGPPASCTLSPSLANFSVNSSGVITGNPTVASTGTYSVSSTNVSGTTTSNSFTITVNQPAPVISYTTPNTYTVGATVNLPVTNNHSAVTTGYAVTAGALPAGITLNTTTGLISGPANTITAAVTATITASTGSSTGSTTVTITVNDVAPTSITYTPPTNVYTVGVAISPLSPTVVGNVPAKISFPTTSLTNPWGMGLDPSNNLYVTNNGSTIVSEFSSSGSAIRNVASGTVNKGIVFDAAGNAYIAKQNGDLVEYSSANVLSTLTTTPLSGWGIAIDGSNNLYIADRMQGQIYKYNITAGTGAYLTTTGITKPVNVAIDGAGNLYILDNAANKVSKYSSSGGAVISTPITGLNTPYGLSVDAAGNIYVGDSGTNSVNIYTSTGTLITSLTNITDPRGVLVDSQGNIYVSDYTSNTVTKYAPRGGYILTGGALPPGLSFDFTTGIFSGTPTAAFSAVTYTITVYNSGGSKSTTVTLSCTVQAPVLTYTPAPTPPATSYSFPVNAAITPLTPVTNTGGPIVPTFGTGVAFTGGTLTNPYGMSFDATGNVYVANYNTPGTNTALSNILKYSSAGAYQNVYIAYAGLQNKPHPTSVGFDATTNAYVSISNGYLYKYVSSTGVYSSTVTLAPNAMNALWVDASGSVLLADLSDQAVYKYTGTTQALSITAASSPYLSGPVSVSTDAAGNIYVLDNTNKDVIEYSSTGAYISTPVTGLSNPYGLYVGSTGYIYVADPGTGTNTGKVSIYSSTGTLLNSLTGLSNPRGVIVDANGNVYVSDFTANTITKYPTAIYTLSGGTLPTGLTFSTTTGVISGTPTVTPSGPITYTVTVQGYGGTTATDNLTISVYTSYDWIGATADWQTTTNWKSNTVPTSSSPVIIGVNYPFTTAPVVSSTGSANAASVTFGNKGGTAGAAKLAGITVNTGYSLTVAGAITKQSDVNSAAAYISTLSGAGTITAASLSVLPNLTATAAYTDGISSSITGTAPAAGLAITGNVTLTSASSPQPATLSFNVTGGVTSVAGTLSTNNATGSTSIFKVSNGTLQLANTAALSALSTAGTNTLSFVNTGATIEYSGAAQTVYTDAAITGLTTGPSYQSIKFSGTGVKTPNGTATNNINVAGDFTNTLANTTADNVALTGTIVNFNGTGVQNLAGGAGPTLAPGALTTATPLTTGTVFGNVTFNNPGAANNAKNIVSGGFSVAYNGVLTMLGSASYTTLNIAAPGSLTLNSTADGSATVAAYNGPLITGNVRVQRYITGGGATYRGYRLVSAPVAGSGANANLTDLTYIKYTSYLKGTTGTAGGFDAAGNPNLFLYRENLPPSNATFTSGNYRSINTLYTSTTPNYSYLIDIDAGPYNVPTGTGYLFFFRGDRHADSIAVEGVAGYASQPAILTATGVLNHGAVPVTNWFTNSTYLLFTNTTANSVVRGFNLVGNPYASTIDLMTASTTPGSGLEFPAPLVGGKGVETNFYELNPVTQNYDIWSNSLNSGAGGGTNQATRYIVSGQGFFVKADTINQKLTFNESAKVNAQNTGTNLFMAANPVANGPQNLRALKVDPAALSKGHTAGEHLRLQMALDSVNTDDIYIGFDPSAQTAYTFNQDALYKQGSGKISLSSMSSDNIALAINVRPLAKPVNTINLNVKAIANGTYTLNMTELKAIPTLYEVWLMDAYLKDSLDMRHNKSYAFNIALTDTNSFGSKRFSLIIREKPGKGVRLLNFIANKVVNGAKVIWKTENEVNYTNFTVQRSIDNGKTFDNLNAFVSNDEGSYSFLDTHPVMPADNYRLKITDLNGNVSYSDIAPVEYSNISNNITKNAITIYPNPTVGPINMAVTQTFKTASFGIQIVNSNGTVVHTTTSASPTWQGDMSKLLPGTYVIQVMNNTDKTVVGKGTFVKL